MDQTIFSPRIVIAFHPSTTALGQSVVHCTTKLESCSHLGLKCHLD